MRQIQVTIAASLLLACGSSSPPNRGSSAPSAPVARFAGEGTGNPNAVAAQLYVREAGKVSLPNGRLAVSDAFINDYPIVVSELPRGDYPVELLVAKSQSDERVAAARVRVRNDPPASWRRVGVIAIDSGTGAFFDPRISSSITPANVERFNDGLLKALEMSSRPTHSSAATSWEGMTFVAFSTGFGDGTYPVYVGFSVAGLPAAVVVDCEILPWPR